MDENQEVINFSDTLEALRNLEVPFAARFLRSFSDLSHKNIKDFLTVWNLLPETRKVGLLEDLDDLLEKDTLVNFDEVAKAVIADSNPEVRVTALGLLWESEQPKIVPMVLNLLNEDPDEAVRASAASLLGRFVLLGELDSISEELKNVVTENLINISTSHEVPRVKQRALESLGYSSHLMVNELIRNAYDTNDVPWVASALCAMGRSADDQWAVEVQSKINSPDVEVQFEAIRAAGELELTSARETLLNLLDEELEDREVRLAVIWALSQIGGEEIKQKFDELLSNTIIEEEIEWIEKAIENLELSSSEGFEMLDYSPDSENEILDFGMKLDEQDDEYSDDSYEGEDEEEYDDR